MSVKPVNSEDDNLLDEKIQNNILKKPNTDEFDLVNTKDIRIKPNPEDEEPNMFFNFLQLFGNKVLLLSSLSDSSGYKYYLFMLWSAFAVVIYLIAKNVKSTETAFLLYSCDVWIIALAVLIFLYR
jgi:hypothetical protein